MPRSTAALLARFAVLLALSATPGLARTDPAVVERFKAWRADLDYLYEQVEDAKHLPPIFKAKGIDWKAVRREADHRFEEIAKEARDRKQPDELADQVGFYGVLEYLIAQLRDGHSGVRAADAVMAAYQAAQPKFNDLGIELMPGAFDTIVVANVFPARRSSSPLKGRGVTHDGTILVSVDGVDAAKYFEVKARRRFEEEGHSSTPGRAYYHALHDLEVADGEKIELVFRELDVPEAARRQYVALSEKKRKSAFRKLHWKTKEVKLSSRECEGVRNPANYRCLNLERPKLEKTSDPEVWYGRLPSGTGYVFYDGVSEKSRAGLEEACRALADCPGLVLDMRHNGGGGNSGIEVFDESKGIWEKPVAVLIGPMAMSAAETEIWSLMEMRSGRKVNARFFGRTTAGASGAKCRFQLPSGFASGVFVVRHWHGGRSRIEGAGLEPDEVVDQDPVELSLKIDSVIAAAERWLDSQVDKKR